MKLDDGWNQIQFNLSDFTRRAYATNYIETLRISIHANCRIRRVYFSERLYNEEDLPEEFKLFSEKNIKNGIIYKNPNMIQNMAQQNQMNKQEQEEDIRENKENQYELGNPKQAPQDQSEMKESYEEGEMDSS
jgi:hypothetical protein